MTLAFAVIIIIIYSSILHKCL